MTQVEKQLLLVDLCARLPYGVICHYNCVTSYDMMIISKANAEGELKGIIPLSDGHIGFMVDCDKIDALEGDIKPYLRPMSSMTVEEREEIKEICADYLDEWENAETVVDRWKLDAKASYLRSKFYNSHHFDWNDLIEKGLALEAPEGMYNIKTE